MRQSPERHTLAAGGSGSTAHFRGWFLILVVVGWLGGWALFWWRGLPGVVALVLVVALLLVADARGLFTLRGRLPWARTGPLGRALLLVLVVALLPLMVTLYLLAASRAYARGRRVRVESLPVALPTEPPTMDDHRVPPAEETPATRPLPSTPRSVPASPSPLDVTSRPTVRAFPFVPAEEEEEPYAAVTESLAVPPEEAEAEGAPAHRRRGGLLVAGLAAVAALLLLSCGVLAYAGPARGLFVPTAPSGGRAISPSGGDAATSGASGGLAPTATPTMPTATPTATPSPTPSPTPKAKHAPGQHPRPKARPRTPTPPGGANSSGSAGSLQVVFTCAPDQLAAPNHICFSVPPGSQVVAVIHARCVSPYTATLDTRHTITPAGDGALAWTWRPQRECQAGGARVSLRITLDGFTGEVPVGWFHAGGR